MKHPPSAPLLVLVADASARVRTHLRALIGREPGLCLAGEADNGASALDLFFKFRPHVVLIDVCLPDRSGFEVAQCIKQAASKCVTILLSSGMDPSVEEAGRFVGAREVCHKADGLDRVRDLLRELAEAQKAPPA